MESLSDVEVEEIDDEPFEFDGRPYLFEPEYTDEELLELENERAEREAQRAGQPEADSRPRTSATWWCSCRCCVQMDTEEESLCCKEWNVLQPNVSQDSAQCVTRTEDFSHLIHPAVLQMIFFIPKINWKKRPKPEGPDGNLSTEQCRLVAYRAVLDWALKGERLGPGNRRILPSCIVAEIRRRHPSPSGHYKGFKDAEVIF